MSETTTDLQLRLILEQQCRELGELLQRKAPAGVGFLLFLADLGADGDLAYVANVERDDAHKLVHEWLDRTDANHPAEGWETAARFLTEVAAAIGVDGESEPAAVLARCRELRAKETR